MKTDEELRADAAKREGFLADEIEVCHFYDETPYFRYRGFEWGYEGMRARPWLETVYGKTKEVE